MIRSIINYYSIVYRFSGGSLLLLTSASLIAGILDGVGLTMLLPLLESSEFTKESRSTSSSVYGIFEAIGVEFTFGNVLFVIAVIFLVKMIIKFLEGVIQARIVSSLLSKWRSELIRMYGAVSFEYYSGKNAGHFINILNTQVNQSTLFVQQFSSFLSRVITGIVYLMLAATLSPIFTVYALVSGVVVVFFLRELLERTKAVSRAYTAEHGLVNKLIIQLVHGYKYLRGAGRYDVVSNQINASVVALEAQRMRSGIYSAVMQSVQEPAPALVVIGLIYFYVEIQGNSIAPILVALLLFYRTMNALLLSQSSWQATLNFAGSIEMLSKEYEETEKRVESQITEIAYPKIKNNVCFNEVSFSYNTTQVLDKVSFCIPVNKTTAIIGASGSGKTTVTDLLVKLYRPTVGSITVDGKPMEDIDSLSWQRCVGIVIQDPIVFDDTIANNICLWEGDFDRQVDIKEKVIKAAKLANCYDFIMSMPDKFTTAVGERGIRLSGGQRQRIAIAREIYKVPSILILDEATSALDAKSEKIVQSSIARLHGSMTVVIVAHRLSTIRDADLVVVLEDGKVKESGSYADLLATDSTLKRMLKEQGIRS